MTGLAKESPETKAFLDEIASVSRKHGMSLSHEDGQGAFIVEWHHQSNIAWLMEAFDGRDG